MEVIIINNQSEYVCLGSCHAVISEGEYKNGLTVCGNETCENKGDPFVKGHKCENCGATYKEGQIHNCS